MTDQLTVLVNGAEYELSESFKDSIEQRANAAFEGNWLFDCHWEANDRGDPILCIDTEGEYVPVDRLEQLEFEMEEVADEQDSSQSDSDSDDETEEIDSGNGMKSVPKDEVDMNPGDGPATTPEDEEPPDTGFMVTHPQNNYVPQPEQDDPEKVPPHPDELPESPTYVQWVPADEDLTEHWETGRALVPLSQNVEWNLQLRADEAPQGATKMEWPDVDEGEEAEIREVPKTDRHDEWEQMLEQHDCEVIAEKQLSDSPESADDGGESSGYTGRTADETLDGKYGGQNWNV